MLFFQKPCYSLCLFYSGMITFSFLFFFFSMFVIKQCKHILAAMIFDVLDGPRYPKVTVKESVFVQIQSSFIDSS